MCLITPPVCRLCSNADETFHHLALDCSGTLHLRRRFFGDRDIQHNMDWDVHEILGFSYDDAINELLDPNDVHNIRLIDTDSEADDESD